MFRKMKVTDSNKLSQIKIEELRNLIDDTTSTFIDIFELAFILLSSMDWTTELQQFFDFIICRCIQLFMWTHGGRMKNVFAEFWNLNCLTFIENRMKKVRMFVEETLDGIIGVKGNNPGLVTIDFETKSIFFDLTDDTRRYLVTNFEIENLVEFFDRFLVFLPHPDSFTDKSWINDDLYEDEPDALMAMYMLRCLLLLSKNNEIDFAGETFYVVVRTQSLPDIFGVVYQIRFSSAFNISLSKRAQLSNFSIQSIISLKNYPNRYECYVQEFINMVFASEKGRARRFMNNLIESENSDLISIILNMKLSGIRVGTSMCRAIVDRERSNKNRLRLELQARHDQVNTLVTEKRMMLSNMSAMAENLKSFSDPRHKVLKAIKFGMNDTTRLDSTLQELFNEYKMCPICENTNVVIAECGHMLCEQCYQTLTTQEDTNCPVCKQKSLSKVTYESDIPFL